MTRSRLPLLVLLLAASLIVSCNERTQTAPSVTSPTVAPAEKPTPAIAPPIRVRKTEVEPLKFPAGIEIVRVPNFLGSKKLPCKPTKVVDSGEKGVGGFACTKIFPITLKVKSGGTGIEVNPPHLTVIPGDCIRWHAVNAGPGGAAARIRRINFIDTQQEAASLGKARPSTWPIDDVCMDGSPDCYMYVSLDDGIYVYQAHVSLDGDSIVKRSDPEVEVGCSSPSCGDPGDMVDVPQ